MTQKWWVTEMPGARTSPSVNGAGEGAEINAIELRNLSVGYEEGLVLRNISIQARRGEITALLGPNGAGKSTLMKSISGLMKPAEGTVLLKGADVTALQPEKRARMGLCHITEGRGVYRSLTVRENLTMQSASDGVDDAIDRATQAFPVLGVRLNQQAGTLSGGEQQMLALAAAHVRDADVLLVDEPSLGLAPIIVDVVFDFLAKMLDGGASLIVVDQYAHRVLSMATNAYVLRRGELSYSGPTKELLEGDLFEHYMG